MRIVIIFLPFILTFVKFTLRCSFFYIYLLIPTHVTANTHFKSCERKQCCHSQKRWKKLLETMLYSADAHGGQNIGGLCSSISAWWVYSISSWRLSAQPPASTGSLILFFSMLWLYSCHTWPQPFAACTTRGTARDGSSACCFLFLSFACYGLPLPVVTQQDSRALVS